MSGPHCSSFLLVTLLNVLTFWQCWQDINQTGQVIEQISFELGHFISLLDQAGEEFILLVNQKNGNCNFLAQTIPQNPLNFVKDFWCLKLWNKIFQKISNNFILHAKRTWHIIAAQWWMLKQPPMNLPVLPLSNFQIRSNSGLEMCSKKCSNQKRLQWKMLVIILMFKLVQSLWRALFG